MQEKHVVGEDPNKCHIMVFSIFFPVRWKYAQKCSLALTENQIPIVISARINGNVIFFFRYCAALGRSLKTGRRMLHVWIAHCWHEVSIMNQGVLVRKYRGISGLRDFLGRLNSFQTYSVSAYCCCCFVWYQKPES